MEDVGRYNCAMTDELRITIITHPLRVGEDVDKLEDTAHAHAGTSPLADDVTLAVIQRRGQANAAIKTAQDGWP